MRTISEKELKDILDKHGKWLRNEKGGEKANLSYANLSYADLRYADLRYADLSSANLSSADLRYADLRYANLSYTDLSYTELRYANLRYADLMQFHCQKHQAFYTFDGTLRIGCHVMPVTEWAISFEEIGKKEGYDELQVIAYGGFIKTCLAHFKAQIK